MSEPNIEQVVSKAVNDAMAPLIKQMGQTLHEAEQRITDRSLEHYQNTSRRLDKYGSNLRKLWKKVNGTDSDPPDPSIPPTANGDASYHKPGLDELAARAHDMASEHDLDIPAMEAKVLVVDGKIENVKGHVAKVDEKVDGLIELQKKQMSAQGMRPEDDERSATRRIFDLFIWFVKEKEGQKFALAAFAAITSLVTAVGTTYALMTGRLPLPNPKQPPALHAPSQDH